MMTEHFESWYATLDTSLRNMVEGGLVATVCGWFGATMFTLLAAAAWVRGRIRERRRDAATFEPEPGSQAAMLVNVLRRGKRVRDASDPCAYSVGPLRVDWCYGRPVYRVARRFDGRWENLLDSLRGKDRAAVLKAAEEGRRRHEAEAKAESSRQMELACQEALAPPVVEPEPPPPPEPKPEPCSPPLSPLASVLLELFACGAVSSNEDGKGFKVGALRVDGDGYSGPMLLTYPVDGKPTELGRLLHADERALIWKAFDEKRKRQRESADEKVRERAVAAIRAQVAVFKGEQAKPEDPCLRDLARLREALKRYDTVTATPAV
jgi:hypothetical protein